MDSSCSFDSSLENFFRGLKTLEKIRARGGDAIASGKRTPHEQLVPASRQFKVAGAMKTPHEKKQKGNAAWTRMSCFVSFFISIWGGINLYRVARLRKSYFRVCFYKWARVLSREKENETASLFLKCILTNHQPAHSIAARDAGLPFASCPPPFNNAVLLAREHGSRVMHSSHNRIWSPKTPFSNNAGQHK